MKPDNPKNGLEEGVHIVLGQVVKRVWHALTGERVKQLKVEGATRVYLKCLDNKKFVVKSGRAEVSEDELRREPKEMASELLDVLRRMDAPRKHSQ